MTWKVTRTLIGISMSIFGDVVLALAFWATWLQVDSAFMRPIETLLVVMLVEFIVIHSAAMMGGVWLGDGSVTKRVKMLAGFGVLYIVFAASYAKYAEEWWPVVVMAGLMVNRMLTVVLVPNPDDGVRKKVEAGWARSTMLYLLLTGATVMLPVPRLGISEEVVDAAEIGGGGLWVEQPQKVIALGALYFSALALLEVRSQWRARHDAVELAQEPTSPASVPASGP